MTLSRLPLLLAFSALTTCAMAGDNLSSPQTTSSNVDVRADDSSPLLGGAENPVPNSDIAPRSRLLFPGARLADVNGDVCYTMRTYKVKPSERIRDHENLFRGYSECAMASDFQIRSAVGHQKKPPIKLK